MDDKVTLLRVPSRATSALINDALVAAGLPGADAARCAELMTEADLTGADGHGIFRLPCAPSCGRRFQQAANIP